MMNQLCLILPLLAANTLFFGFLFKRRRHERIFQDSLYRTLHQLTHCQGTHKTNNAKQDPPPSSTKPDSLRSSTFAKDFILYITIAAAATLFVAVIVLLRKKRLKTYWICMSLYKYNKKILLFVPCFYKRPIPLCSFHKCPSLALAPFTAYIYLTTHHGAPFRIVLSQPIIINDIFAPFCEYRPKTLLRQKYSV